jgi:hypothetical protein
MQEHVLKTTLQKHVQFGAANGCAKPTDKENPKLFGIPLASR